MALALIGLHVSRSQILFLKMNKSNRGIKETVTYSKLHLKKLKKHKTFLFFLEASIQQVHLEC